jgi:uncharacterized protein YyaL (SSP411 family)
VNKSHTNQLIHEKSPYLLQHAHNPVNWFPWGEEPFKIAQKKNFPLLVSIGYATCHWCHVMERESFEDPDLAKLLNANFISIKIVPFYSGTYFPPEKRFNIPSFTDVLIFLTKTWINEPEKVKKQSEALAIAIRESSERKPTLETTESLDFDGEDKAAKLYESHYDNLNHGFRFQPQNKFPPSMGLSLLLRHHHRTGTTSSLEMTKSTLRAMKWGGIYDQIGGGLSRYSTDYRWLVPHFEKMLYDNSLFITALIETFQVTGHQEFSDYANDVLYYIDQGMTSKEGAFFSAEDADSEGVEGKFYVWSKKEIESVLGRQASSIVVPFFNITKEGNFEHKNILNQTNTYQDLAKKLGLAEDTVINELSSARKKLIQERNKRIRPLLDDKILTSWNGLMISAMAKTGRVLEDLNRIAKAEKAVEFILSTLKTPEGKLLRRFREGEARYDGYLFDYSSIAVACLELYEATYNTKYIIEAQKLMQIVEDKFSSEGAYYETAVDAEKLIVRQISGYDGVEPSGNSNASLAFLKLGAYLANPDFIRRAEKIFLAFHEDLTEYGMNSSFMMQALHLYLGGLKEVAIIGKRNDLSTQEILKTIRSQFFPNAVFAFAYEDEVAKKGADLPLLSGKIIINGKATAYVCRLGTCLTPVNSSEDLVNLLKYEEN